MRFTAAVAIVFSLSLAMSSCNKGNVRETPSGYKVTYVKKGDGKVAKAGEVIVIDMAVVDANDSTWYETRNSNYPDMVKIAEDTKKDAESGINEAFRMLSKGDSVLFAMRSKDFFSRVWRTAAPAGMDDESMFTFRIKCREVFDEPTALKFQARHDSVRRIEEEARYAEYTRTQLAKDTAIIDNYLKGKGMKATVLPSGLRYILKSKGQGDTIVDGDLVSVKYAGQTLDGREFDSGEYTFTVGRREVIQGWDAMALNMKKGTSVTVFIPSTMAYGQGGRPPVIMPDAILIFDMEILSIQ